MGIPKSRTQIEILGCGEAFDAGIGNNSCVLDAPGLPRILFDCGYQIPERLWRHPRLGAAEALDALYFTHLHADHSFGVVPLLVRMAEDGRRGPLRVLGPPGTKAFVERILDLGYPGARRRLPFRISFKVCRAGQTARYRGLRLRFARSSHPVMNLAVRVELPSGRSFAVSGDGALTPGTRRLFLGTDLLLHEVYYPSEREAAGSRSHESLEGVLEYMKDAGIGRLGLTHAARGHRRAIARRAAREGRSVFVARPGQRLAV